MTIYNPFAKYGISGGWRNGHFAIDYPTPIGYKFGAPEDGVYYRLPDQKSRVPGQAGIWGELRLDDGRKIRFCHLKRHIAGNGQRVKQGDILGETGNTGYVIPKPTIFRPWLGAHMHTYGLNRDGSRWNWSVGASSTLPKPSKPAPAGGSKPDITKLKFPNTVTTTADLNLRLSPDGRIITTIPKGTAIYTDKASGKWVPAKFGKRFGYVHTDYLVPRAMYVRVGKGKKLHLRKGASTTSASMGQYPDGYKVIVLGVAPNDKTNSSAWYRVRVNTGKTGYMARAYLKTK